MIDEETQEDSLDNQISITRHKIFFVGGGDGGKTSILNRIIDGSWSENYDINIGIDFCEKVVKFSGQNIKFQLWDTSAQEKYKALLFSYLRGSSTSIVFIVYEVCQHSNFENIKSWISFIKMFEVKIVVLVGNKIDLNFREVETKEGEELAKKEGLLFFECSAKTNENIMNMFYSSIARLPIFEIYNESERDNIVRELIEENGFGDFKEDRGNHDLILIKENKISRNGEFPKRRKKCCKCLIQ